MTTASARRYGLYIVLLAAVVVAVVGLWADGEGVFADDSTDPPQRPTELQVSTEPGSLEVSVDWDDTPGAASYKVRWRVAGPGNRLNEGIEAQSSDAVITVADYGEWVLRVEACNDSGCGPAASRRFVVAPAPAPTISIPVKPTGLTASTESGSLEVSVDWDDTPGAASYKVRWRAAGSGNPLSDGIEAQSPDAVITVADYGEWVLRVEACNDSGCGPGASRRFAVEPAPAPAPTVKPAPTVRVPGRPAGLAVSAQPGPLEYLARWQAVEDAAYYRLQWAKWNSPGLGNSAEMKTTSATFSVNEYGDWLVHVQACNDAGCGLGTPKKLAVVPDRPTGLQVKTEPGSLEVSLDWDDVPGPAVYRVRWRGTDSGSRLNEGVKVLSSDAVITVADYGEWMVRVQACGRVDCGRSAKLEFSTVPAPSAEPEDTPAPQSPGRGYRGQLGEVLVELSLLRPTQEADPQSAAQTALRTRQSETPASTSIVYAIDDSGSMDGDFPEVRTALEDVRDESMPNTKVALLKFGTDSSTLFGLTAHSSAPWNDNINKFGGKLGGTFYVTPLQNARTLLDADSAEVKKIIFMSDGLAYYPVHEVLEIKESGIIVESIGFGNHSLDDFAIIQLIASNTGGEYRAVSKPSQGTKNDPEVTPTAMADILKGTVADNTATLFLVDFSLSVYDLHHGVINPALSAAATKAGSSTNAKVGLASFLGETSLASTYPDNFPKYEVVNAIGSSSLSITHSDDALHQSTPSSDRFTTGSTDIDNALSKAFTTISAATETNKRVVLISDGISAVDVQDSTLSSYKNDSAVTLDVVAWGPHADRVQLKTWSTTAGGTFSVAKVGPPAPNGLSAMPGNGSIALSWNDPSDSSITGYQYRHHVGWSSATGPQWSAWMDIDNSDASTTSHTVTSLTNLVFYIVELRALYGSDLPGVAGSVETIVPPPPQAPHNLNANGGDTTIRLSWSNPDDSTINKYQYRLSVDGGTTWNPDWTDIANSEWTTTSHTLTGLTNGTTYTIELRAVVSTDTSGDASSVTATPSSS